MISHIVLNEALARCGSPIRSAPAIFGAATIDSRTARPGDLFCAFKGERTDAHAFVPDLVSRGVFCVGSEPLSAPGYAPVPDVAAFLAELARLYRASTRTQVLALTGSSGKTTTRVIAGRLLAQNGFTVHETEGNLNNHIGLPLVLLNAPLSSDAIVLEMGMNHAGEIAYLCRIASPDAVLITNIGFAHIGNFASREDLAAAKLEIFEHSRGRVALNLDDSFIREWAETHPEREATTFSIEGRDSHIAFERHDEDGIHLRWYGHPLLTAAPARPSYLLEDLFAAAALVAPFVRDPATLGKVLLSLPLPPLRGEVLSEGDRIFIADCYNANPDSMRKSIASFVRSDPERDLPSYLVLGDMAELGRFSEKFHRELVKYLKTSTVINKVFLLGEEFEKVRDEFMDDKRFAFFHTIAELRDALPERGRFLVKGSRRNRLETLFAGHERVKKE